jgi:2-succinyl-5-enolpyruvyl-6-hydroxy-3-cyclohexene-1-carboxylate synthase
MPNTTRNSETLTALPELRSLWTHRNGNLYQVVIFTNVPTAGVPNKAGYEETVVYRNMANGTHYSRPVSDWHRSMTPATFSAKQLRLQNLTDAWAEFKRVIGLSSIRSKAEYKTVMTLHKELTKIVGTEKQHPLRELLHLADDVLAAYDASDSALDC